MEDQKAAITQHLEAVVRTARLLRVAIEKETITPQEWLTIGDYMGDLGKNTTAAAYLIGDLVGINAEDINDAIIAKLKRNAG